MSYLTVVHDNVTYYVVLVNYQTCSYKRYVIVLTVCCHTICIWFNALKTSINRMYIYVCNHFNFFYLYWKHVQSKTLNTFSVWPIFSPTQIVFWMSISWRPRIYWYMDILRCMDMFLITNILDLAYVQNYIRCLS